MASAKNTSLLGQKSLCVITGASRGIGKEIAIQLSSKVGPNSKFLLLARNEKDLAATAEEIKKKNSSIAVDISICDISKVTEGDTLANFEKKLEGFLKAQSSFDVAFMVHNAATTGDLSKRVAKFENGSEIREHIETNLVSFILLNNAFLRIVGIGDKGAIQRVVINITSLVAISKDLPGFGLYPVGKAAREGFMRALSAEETDLRVLNYSPGPVKTDMAETVKETTWDEGGRQFFKDAFEQGTILTAEQTVTKLMGLLKENTFENASHVDYYDIK